jgi:outer membrane immunogenic protein
MRKLKWGAAALLPALVFAASISSASAADLSMPAPARVPVMQGAAPIVNWTGFYAGINGGWGSGNTTASTGSTYNVPISGGILGAQAGYNFMFSNNIVAGFEGDISWSGMKGSITPSQTVTQSLDWLGTFRGRVGYAMNTVMPYITGGFAMGGGTRTTSIGSQSATATQTGYVLGAGIEWAFAQNWTAKLEYQYVSLGAQTYNFSSPPPSPGVSMSSSIIRVGLNRKF